MPKSPLDWLGVVSLWIGAIVLAFKSAGAPLVTGGPPILAASFWNFVPAALLTVALLIFIYRLAVPHAGASSPRDAKRRKRIREKLGEFLEEGLELQNRAADETTPLPDNEAQEWLNKVADYLTTELDSSYVARMRDGSVVPTVYTSVKEDRLPIWGGIRSKVFHIGQFIRELA